VNLDAAAVKIESIPADNAGKEPAQVHISGTVAGYNGGSAKDAVIWHILNPAGAVVSRAVAKLDDAGSFAIDLMVEQPELWDVDSPVLYTADATLALKGHGADTLSLKFGIRSAEFRPNQGFFLNGRRLQLRGCNRHESMPGFGRALTLEQHREDARLIKAMGLNFVRLSHYPQHPEFLNACDELGLLVYAEIASWKSVRGGRWLKRAARQMRDMIIRDRNHPSVILWGMGNEGRHRGAYLELYDICKQLDAARAVTYAENHLYRARRKKTLGLPDVWGINYEFDAMEEGRDACRLKCVVVSECSNYPHTLRGDAAAEQKQLDTIKSDLERIENIEYVAGFALWCFNDYATLRKKRYKRYSGLVDAERKPKASAYWLAEKFGGDLGGRESGV
jgi:beta-galactosidase/beta-glucuronidase